MIWDREKFYEPDTKMYIRQQRLTRQPRSNHVKERYEHQGTGMFFREVEEREFRVDTGEPKDVSLTASADTGDCEKEQHSLGKDARGRVLRENCQRFQLK